MEIRLFSSYTYLRIETLRMESMNNEMASLCVETVL